jgi:hypothetical protein
MPCKQRAQRDLGSTRWTQCQRAVDVREEATWEGTLRCNKHVRGRAEASRGLRARRGLSGRRRYPPPLGGLLGCREALPRKIVVPCPPGLRGTEIWSTTPPGQLGTGLPAVTPVEGSANPHVPHPHATPGVNDATRADARSNPTHRLQSQPASAMPRSGRRSRPREGLKPTLDFHSSDRSTRRSCRPLEAVRLQTVCDQSL